MARPRLDGDKEQNICETDPILSYINSSEEVKHSSDLGTPGSPMMQSLNFHDTMFLDSLAAIILEKLSVTMWRQELITARLNHFWILELHQRNPDPHCQIRLRITPHKLQWVSGLQCRFKHSLLYWYSEIIFYKLPASCRTNSNKMLVCLVRTRRLNGSVQFCLAGHPKEVRVVHTRSAYTDGNFLYFSASHRLRSIKVGKDLPDL